MTAMTTARPTMVRTSPPPPAPVWAAVVVGVGSSCSGVFSPSAATAGAAPARTSASVMGRRRRRDIRWGDESGLTHPPHRMCAPGALDGAGARFVCGPHDLRDPQPEFLVDDDDLAARDRLPVAREVQGLPGEPVERDDRARTEGERLADGHAGAADLDGELDRDVLEAL